MRANTEITEKPIFFLNIRKSSTGNFFSGQVAMESLCTQDSENQQGVPEKSTFLKFLTGYEPTLICFGSDILKIATVSVFSDTAFIIVFFFKNEGQLWLPLTRPKTPFPPLPHIF